MCNIFSGLIFSKKGKDWGKVRFFLGKLYVMTVRISYGLLFLVSVTGMFFFLYGYITSDLYLIGVGLPFVVLYLVLYLNCIRQMYDHEDK